MLLGGQVCCVYQNGGRHNQRKCLEVKIISADSTDCCCQGSGKEETSWWERASASALQLSARVPNANKF